MHVRNPHDLIKYSIKEIALVTGIKTAAVLHDETFGKLQKIKIELNFKEIAWFLIKEKSLKLNIVSIIVKIWQLLFNMKLLSILEL